jgi:hypothetical protein
MLAAPTERQQLLRVADARRRTNRMNFDNVVRIGQIYTVVLISSALAAPTLGKNWADGTANWNVPANWNPAAVPTAGETVNIAFTDGTARTVTLNTNTPALALVSVDLTGAGTAASTLSIPGANTLTASAMFVGGYNGSANTAGRGAVIHSNGNVTMTTGSDLALAVGAGSTGTYTLSGVGGLFANQSEFIGYGGTGTFNQSAGTNTINASSVGSLDLGGLSTGNGTYNLSGTGVLNVTAQEHVGDQGTGSFIQTGGTNTISGTKPSDATPNDLNIAYGATGIGTYSISGGTATVPGDVYVGGSAAGVGGFGTLNVSGTGTMTIAGGLSVYHHLNSVANLSGGTLRVKALNLTAADFHWTGGTLNFTQGVTLSGDGTGGTTSTAFGTALALGTTQTLQVTGNETIGGGGPTFSLTLNNGSANNVSGILQLSRRGSIFQNTGSTVTANSATVGDSAVSGATFQQNGGTTAIATSLALSKGPGSIGSYTLGGGSLSSASLIAGDDGSTGTFFQNGGTNQVTGDLTVGRAGPVSGSFSMVGGSTTVNGNVIVGQSSGTDLLDVGGAGSLTVGGTIQILNVPNASFNLTGGSVTTAGVNLNGDPSHFDWTLGQLNISTSVTWDPFASSTATGSIFGRVLTLSHGRHLNITGTETLSSSFFMSVESGSQHIVSSTLTVNSGGELRLDGGTLAVGGLVNNGTFSFSAGTLVITGAGASVGTPILTGSNTSIIVNANNVSLGSASNFAGFNHQGTLGVGINTVTLNSAGYARLGVLTTLSGGTINAPNGVTFASGSNFQGSGTVNARVAGELGAMIEATGALALGDATSPAGFNFNGELRTKQFAVTLNSSAPIGLGNLTVLGSGATAGTLAATNGFVVDFDEAVTGVGTINSTNTLAKPATINGTVQGNSAVQPITLSGYIKGTGTFSNVNFTGTFSPGLSPTTTTAGNIGFSNSSTLVMELGGSAAGTQYDEILSSGQIAFDGTLEVSLINGFTPAAGQSFNLFDWSSTSGTFDTLTLPSLGGSLDWNTSQLYTTGVLSIVAAGILGDYNQNGTVDAGDYVVYRKKLGSSTSLPNDDTPGVGTDDYTRWRSRFGQSSSGNGSSSLIGDGMVPEAPSLFLLIATIFGGGATLRLRY